MNFQKKEIKSQRLAIIDIGSYKIRVAICKLKNFDIELIGYGEKRQDSSNTVSGEIINLEGVCDDIKIALQKAEKDAGIKIESIIIGTPFSEVYFSAKKINYVRVFPERDIDKKELGEIIDAIQKKAIKIYMKDIEKSVIYRRSDLKLSSSHIGKIKIDNIATPQLLAQKGTNITVFLTNIFMPNNKFEILEYIARTLGKKIIKVIPGEFAITHLFEDHKNLVIIDLGNAYTTVIIKKKGNLIGSHKIPLGMNDLIKSIESTTTHTHASIIEEINSIKFSEMQQQFLDIFFPAIGLAIAELLKDSVCPNQFFLLGGGANKFIKDGFSEEKLGDAGLKIAGKIEFIKPRGTYFNQIYSRSRAGIISMILASKSIFAQQNTPLNDALKKASNEIQI